MPDPEMTELGDDAEEAVNPSLKAKSKNDGIDDDVPDNIIKPLRDHFRAAKEDVNAITTDSLMATNPTLALAQCLSLAVADTMRQIQIAWHITSGGPVSPTHVYQFLFNFFHLRETLAKLATVKGQIEEWPTGPIAFVLNHSGKSILQAGLQLSEDCLQHLQSGFPVGFTKKDLLHADQFDKKVIKWIDHSSGLITGLRPVSLTTPDALIDENTRFQNALQLEYDAIRPSKPNLFKYERDVDGKASSSWRIRFRSQEIGPIRTSMTGFSYIAELLRYPDRQFDAVNFELISNPISTTSMISNEGSSTSKKSGEPVHKGPAASKNNADWQAIQEVSRDRDRLQIEITSLSTKLDTMETGSEKSTLKEELHDKEAQLATSNRWLSEANRPLKVSDSTQARQRINQKIKDARKKIRENGCGQLADHLNAHISSSENSFAYRSDPSIKWEFD